MSFPSGDHTGFADTESTSRTGSPPFTGTLKTCIAGPSLAATAIQLPSGDQDGAPRTSSDPATGRAPAPVADRQYIVERAGRRTGRTEPASVGRHRHRAIDGSVGGPPHLGRVVATEAPHRIRSAASREVVQGAVTGKPRRGGPGSRQGEPSSRVFSGDPVTIGVDQSPTVGFETVATSRLGWPVTSGLAAMEM